MTFPIKTIDVKPKIPEALDPLKELAYNLWFVWNHDAAELFRRMNPDLWEKTRKNPVELLCRLSQKEIKNLAHDEGFLAHMERVHHEFKRYMSEHINERIFGKHGKHFRVAYFTAECGVADCLSIYSGGLGILSGDHLKSASDLNLPVCGVSLAYQRGYFRQYLTQDGWQMETYPANRFSMMPMTLVRTEDGAPVTVSVGMKGETVKIQVWKVNVGRFCLYLLDTNVEGNSDWARDITSQLYGGDHDMRIRQEIVLGIGGARALLAMGIESDVFHINEGHSAFALMERIRDLREKYALNFNEALEFVRATSVFTTHTPVPAGIDVFHPDLMRIYFEEYAKSLGISFDVFLGFGRQEPRNKDEWFCMAVLALRLSNWCNAVSRLHEKVSRKMWEKIWPKTPEVDLPITHITNGVHIPSWISQGMRENYDRYLGPRWIEDPDNVKVWERVDLIANTELWRTHERARERLVAFARRRLRAQLARRGASGKDLTIADEVLSSEVLTIGFARRFAPYKRAYLILKDIGRLENILTNEDRPAQIIFAGKAHPQDQMGKDLIKQIVQISNQEKFRRHIVFLEDYDMEVARYMVQGVDVWLNTPRRLLEACGTSGMKAVANGALHFSVLDGWWDEGYDRDVGWAIGSGEEYGDEGFQDEIESRALYDILEKDIIPLFYSRGSDGIPRGWVEKMKASMHRLCPVFNTHRMVEDYWEMFYLPAAERGFHFKENGWEPLKALSAWRDRVMYGWGDVAIKEVRMPELEEMEVGDTCHVEAEIHLGELDPSDVVVEVYCGILGEDDICVDRVIKIMEATQQLSEGLYKYESDFEFAEAGRFGLNIRVLPNHPNPESRHAMALVVWGG